MLRIYKTKKYLVFFVLSVFLMVAFKFVQAQDLGLNEAAGLGLPSAGATDPRLFVINVVRFILGFLGVVATIIILYGGWLWMTSAGELMRVQKAKKTLIAAIIGLIIIIAAFAIVSFVANFMRDTIGSGTSSGLCDPPCLAGQCCCSGVCQSCPCGSLTPTGSSFRLRSTSPVANAINQPRNVIVRAFLSRPAAPSVDDILSSNFILRRIGDINPGTGDFIDGPDTDVNGIVSTSSNRTILNFTPSDNLDSWSRYQVVIDGSTSMNPVDHIIDFDGNRLTCGLPAPCNFTFDTNDLIDAAVPTVRIIPTQICYDDGTLSPGSNIIGGWGRDDTGISFLRAYYEMPHVNIFDVVGTGNRYQYAQNVVDTSGMTVGDVYTFTVEADDLVLNTEADSFEATIRAGHCCNDQRDLDEEGVDCGGADCDSCASMNPIITNLSPDNGAPGNFITIMGRYFGMTPGRVYFSNAAGDLVVEAQLPNTVNPNCNNNWSNNQIVVVVPGGAATGPIMVERSDGRSDTTAADSEPYINFEVNTIARPGLCLANPNTGFFNTEFDLHGIAFGGTNRYVRFGNESDYITANNMHDWTNLFVSAQVPNITRGLATVYANIDTVNSNFLYFIVQQDTDNNPVIDYIDPPQGPNNQYITIYGSGFMSYQPGVSQVSFTNFGTGETTAAGIDFPVECRNSWWRASYITVKVPATVANGNYQVRVTNRANNTSEPENFNIIAGTPTPGICLLSPHNGPVGTAVNIYGDNMGSTPGTAIFYNNVSVTPAASEWRQQLVAASVPAGAVTGPVVISNGANSNGLPFTVGSCTSNGDCESGEECCGSGSSWSGICRNVGTCVGAGFTSTAFGWTFSTASAVVHCSDGGECSGVYPACSDPNEFCDPDSDCTCQPLNDTADSCRGRSARTNRCDPFVCPNSPGTCSPYTATGYQVLDGFACDDSCAGVANCGVACNYVDSLDSCVLTDRFCTRIEYDIFGREIVATCAAYGSSGEYRWQISTTVDCPSGWLNIGRNRCVNLTETCLPCPNNFICRDYDNDSQGDCVANRRMCVGTSHCIGTQCVVSDRNSCECCCSISQNNLDGTNPSCCAPLTCEGNCGSDASGVDTDTYGFCSGCASASDPDSACNCEGHSGKYCDTTTNPAGICLDCAALNSTECTNHDACCVDVQSGDACRGVGVDGQRNINGTCAYYSCEISGPDANCVAGETGAYKTLARCEGRCVGSADIPIGQRCLSLSPVYSCTSGINNCGVYDCISNDLGSDCRCCCDPNNNTCPSGLDCTPKEPCDSPAGNRGICCGCVSNDQCYGGGFQGCGTDSCCHERPQISEVFPIDEQENVCRNTLIRATFNQRMNIQSFTGNIILLGDYEDSPCPAGTTYLALEAPHRNQLSQFINKIRRSFHRLLAFVWPQPTAFAQFNPEPGRSYCAVRGVTTGYNDVSDNGVLEFKLSSVLDPNRVYFAIVRGDRNLDNQQGVISFWGIGMNDITYDGQPEMVTFNGIAYYRSSIWAFRTGDDICELNSVSIDPASYLFTTANTAATFIAEPRSSDGQILIGIPGVYEWTWNWRSSKPSVAVVSNDGGPDSIQTVTSQNVQDDRTVISATASVVGQSRSRTGQSNVYVFLCENPWPARNSDGSWAPWRDQAGNCIAGSGDCTNSYNYELYYCRDSGRAGTFDDLPPLLGTTSTPPVIRGRSSTTLKEAYFFRENVPTATTSLTIVDDGTGNSVTANWIAVPEVSLTNYRVYWGTASGNYSNNRELPNTANTFQVTGLQPGTRYYFRLTAIYSDNRVETDLYNEISIVPRDTTPPDFPTNFTAATTTISGEIRLSWDAVNGAVSYNIYYGTTLGVYGTSRNVGNITSVILSGLRSDNSYYFSVSAVDAAGNESSPSAISAGPISPSP